MLLDWFTIIAQLVNFLILVWLLKRFLYQPILNAIDAREKRIATELAEADAKKTEAQQERNEFQRKNEELNRQRDTMLNQAREEANAERMRILESTRQEADYLAARRQEALRGEQQHLSEALSRRTREEVFAIAGKALADLADATLEERMTGVFLQRLHGLGETELAELKSAFKSSDKPLLVRSAYPLPPAQSSAIEAAVRKILGKECEFQFETAPNLIGGIELSMSGYKVAWSIAAYLDSLEKRIGELLKAQSRAETKTGQSSNE